MNVHENARTTPVSRALLVRRISEEGWSVGSAAAAAGVSRHTAYKWVQRQREDGVASLRDRSSRAHHIRHALPVEWTQIILYLRHFRQPARLIGGELGLARSTVSAVLARHGLGAQRALDPPRPVARYERRQAGDLLHLDIKRLSRFWRPGHRVTGSRTLSRVGLDTNSCMSRSTTTLASPSHKSCRMNGARLALPFSAARAPGLPTKASTFAAFLPTTELVTGHITSANLAWHSDFVMYAPGRAGRKPTARQSASSRLCFVNGPTGGSMPTAGCEHSNCRAG